MITIGCSYCTSCNLGVIRIGRYKWLIYCSMWAYWVEAWQCWISAVVLYMLLISLMILEMTESFEDTSGLVAYCGCKIGPIYGEFLLLKEWLLAIRFNFWIGLRWVFEWLKYGVVSDMQESFYSTECKVPKLLIFKNFYRFWLLSGPSWSEFFLSNLPLWMAAVRRWENRSLEELCLFPLLKG